MERGGYIDGMAVQIAEPGVAIGDVDGNRHVEAACLVVDRIEIRINEQVVTFNGAHQHGASAIFFSVAYLIQSIGHAQSGCHAGPPQPTFSLPPDVGQPAVPALA